MALDAPNDLDPGQMDYVEPDVNTDQRVDPAAGDARLADDAVALAGRLLAASLADESRAERRRRERLGRLLADANGRELILALTDEVLRVDDPRVAARRFGELVEQYPTPALGAVDGVMLRAGASIAPKLPRLVMPLVVRRVKAETRGIVLPADDPAFARHLTQRADDGVRLNINPLGEAILSDAEADERMRIVLEKIARPDVDYVSVKISSIVANLDVLAFDDTVARVADRLRTLFQAANAARPRTFVNLDMEEYRDLDLTLAAYMAVLGEDEFATTDAGIVLQAYLPDSHDAAERLGAWAVARRDAGGGRIKVRLVKGANLAMEEVEAELHGWVAAPYGTKADVDASYKALLDSLLRPEWSDAIRVGIASHNLFDIAWAMVRTADLGAGDRVVYEMLEGMAPAQARAVLAVAGDLLMYSPVVADEDFDASIAYLSRRLDENTQADNFLRSLFTLTVDSAEFTRQEEMFRHAVDARHGVDRARRRRPVEPQRGFSNEPEGDFTDPAVREAVVAALVAPADPAVEVITDTDGIDAVVAAAAGAASEPVAPDQRLRWLLATADVMRVERFTTLALMAAETGKTIHEGDPEIAEAIDFCDYYGGVGTAHLAGLAAAGYQVEGRGVVAVVAPWNFPYAIPTGGVAAALAAGNAVILKPAPEAIRTGTHIAEQFWRAGVPRDRLQVVVCEDGPVGTHLVTHPALDTVILTGAYSTASMFLDWRPELRVLAETSGKNALVVTAAADLDLAIADLVRSAFGHAGQKCSAASLGIVEAAVYDDPTFLRRLRHAVLSLRVGSPADTATMVGPTIARPSDKLERALTSLEPGERWLVEPELLPVDGDLAGRVWSPGVRIAVRPGSWFHQTECFGPVLGIMRADDLDHAIELQNATEFGLTGGLHSLDPAEIETWLRRVQIGNAYVNRHTTGAIVRRQPFGGWKKSSVGGSAKAGGPGYVQQLARITEPSGGDALARATTSFAGSWRDHFSVDHDPSGLAAEANILRYHPVAGVAVRHDGSDSDGLDLLRLAARTTGVRLVESDARAETDDEFVGRLGGVERVRLLTDLSDDARRACHAADVAVDGSPPVSDGFVELYRWVREQSISQTMHRHGRLTPR
ncbi:MAG: bifunctional proline dehydrogenase/L-glutamate gamma-semialdehyde dehydrogenase [Ilumatobacter sp.]|nr:bifunctional proline dehydrogenase/L-glutamate gamma-semialdehyde dehydrogenase [Ilumatobacter sp.]